jgi:starch phosphorylase
MKLALNGALTIGTLDGANIEIRDRVGEDNFFLFGLDTPQAQELARDYRGRVYYEQDAELREAIDVIAAGTFAKGDREVFRPLVDTLLGGDQYLTLADYRAYIDAQDRVEQAWLDTERWTRMSILNSARCGFFSADRTVRDYCREIWRVSPVRVAPPSSD